MLVGCHLLSFREGSRYRCGTTINDIPLNVPPSIIRKNQRLAGGLNFNYDQFMVIGMVVNMLFMTTTMNMASLVEDRNKNFTQEMMIAPISRYSIVIGKIFGSSFGAIVGMVGTLIVGLFIELNSEMRVRNYDSC